MVRHDDDSLVKYRSKFLKYGFPNEVTFKLAAGEKYLGE